MTKNQKTCEHKDCKSECQHKVDVKALNKSKESKKKIIEGNKIVNKK